MAAKICMVTGANSGIGKVTARELARMGATVIMVCRSRAKGEAALAEIKRATGSNAVELMLADLGSQRSIRALAETFRQKYDRLHVLVNNAGAINFQRTLTEDGIEATFAVNHLGSFLLAGLLLDVLKASAPARIVNVSSGAHYFAKMNFSDLQGARVYSSWRAYGQSKLANVLFTVALAKRLEGTGVTVNCLHPGFVRSNFAGTSVLAKVLIGLARPFNISPEQGAETSIYLATAPEVEQVTGKYFTKKRPVRSSRESTDLAVAEMLWETSAELTGMAR